MARQRSLLDEVERDLLDGKPLADLLRKCILLGSRSGSLQLREWATKELRGYKNDDKLPEYRDLGALIQLDGSNMRYQFTAQRVPESALPSFVREEGLGEHVEFRNGVGELEAMIRGLAPGEHLKLAFPGSEVIAEMFDKQSGVPSQTTHRIYWSLPGASVEGLLDDVRTSLAELLAELASTMPADQEEPNKEQADNAFNVAVNGAQPNITINHVQSSGSSTANVAQSIAPSAGDSDPSWWTLWHKIGAFIVGAAVVAGAVIAALAYWN